MTNAIKITDFADRLRSLLTGRFQRKENFIRLFTALGDGAQDIEDTQFELLEDRSLGTATGVQLDLLGDLLGETRQGRTDEDYRSALSLRIIISQESGEPESIIRAALSLSGATRVQLLEGFPASIVVDIREGDPPDNFNSELKRATMAGVGLTTIQSSANPFTTEGDPDGDGLNEDGQDVGGQLAEVI